MTQNARVALFIPTTDDSDPGEIVEARGAPSAQKVIPTRFSAQSGSGGSVGEAPVDGKFYARSNADWTRTVNAAPNDGLMYGQKSNAWQVVAPFPEAPTDGKQYARSNAAWTEVTSLPAVIDGGTF